MLGGKILDPVDGAEAQPQPLRFSSREGLDVALHLNRLPGFFGAVGAILSNYGSDSNQMTARA